MVKISQAVSYMLDKFSFEKEWPLWGERYVRDSSNYQAKVFVYAWKSYCGAHASTLGEDFYDVGRWALDKCEDCTDLMRLLDNRSLASRIHASVGETFEQAIKYSVGVFPSLEGWWRALAYKSITREVSRTGFLLQSGLSLAIATGLGATALCQGSRGIKQLRNGQIMQGTLRLGVSAAAAALAARELWAAFVAPGNCSFRGAVSYGTVYDPD